jgi:inner membrane protein
VRSITRAAAVQWIAEVLPTVPDVDVLAFAFGIPYGAPLGHRGLSHALVVALALGLASARFALPQGVGRRPWSHIGLLFGLLTATHGLLDMATDGGLGVAYLAPFRFIRLFLPWRPVRVSPIGAGAFISETGLEVLANEACWIWLPLGVLVFAVWLSRRIARLGDAWTSS